MDWNSLGPENWLVVAVVFGLVEAGLQLWLLTAVSFRPIGDEYEYIERGRSGRSFGSEPFLRVPFLPTLAWAGGRIGHPIGFLRLASIASSAAAMAATAGAATRTGGAVIASILCLGLLLIPERIVLGSRIWPDVHLAATTGGMALVLSMTPAVIDPDRSAIVVAVLIAAAVLIRLDALILIPTVTALWMITSPTCTPAHIEWLTGLPLAVFGAWWLVARFVLGQPWPDTTWKFNLGIAAQETHVQKSSGPITIDDLIERHQKKALPHPTDTPRPPLRAQESNHWTAVPASVISRFRALLGPDTFVQGKVLADVEWKEGSILRPVLTVLLRISVPTLVAMTIGVFAWYPSAAGWLAVPALAMMIPAILFHARTRYRLPLLYGLVPVLAGSLARILSEPQLPSIGGAVLFGALIVLFGLLLARRPHRLERL